MEVTLQTTIPDDVAADIQNGGNTPLARRLLELAALKAYEADLITTRQLREMLGFETREELFAFFKANGVRDDSFTLEDLERGQAIFAALGNKP
jgi:hypothetical protein